MDARLLYKYGWEQNNENEMTREQKTAKKKERAANRKAKRNEKFRSFLNYNTDMIRYNGFRGGKFGGDVWQDSNSPTGFSQKCSYQGTCQHPCNGDC